MQLQLRALFDLFQICAGRYHDIKIVIWGRLILYFIAYFALFLSDLGYDGRIDSAPQHFRTTTVASVEWA